jgi:hypothetical protein
VYCTQERGRVSARAQDCRGHMGKGDYAENKSKYVPFGRSWPPMITTSIPFPSNFRQLTGHLISSFGENVPALFILRSTATLVCPYSSQTTPHLSHTRNPVQQKFAAIVRRWARTVRSYESIDDRMTPTVACPFACPSFPAPTTTIPRRGRTPLAHGK